MRYEPAVAPRAAHDERLPSILHLEAQLGKVLDVVSGASPDELDGERAPLLVASLAHCEQSVVHLLLLDRLDGSFHQRPFPFVDVAEQSCGLGLTCLLKNELAVFDPSANVAHGDLYGRDTCTIQLIQHIHIIYTDTYKHIHIDIHIDMCRSVP